jgi:DNA polymerase delta subunit 1
MPTTFESDLPYPLRFMIDCKIVGMSWIRLNPGKYTIRKFDGELANKVSRCQIEIDVENFVDIICLPCEG